MATFYATVGDVNKVISTRLRDEVGYADLTGATIVFHAWNQSDHSQTISGTAVVGTQTTSPGLVSYTLVTTDLDGSPATAGTYDVEWQVTISTVVVTFPNPGYDTLILQAQIA